MISAIPLPHTKRLIGSTVLPRCLLYERLLRIDSPHKRNVFIKKIKKGLNYPITTAYVAFAAYRFIFRAYIAASRRSDRKLEARVKSARRASEVHKQRTGRFLKVREEDVINDEIYEEEHNDLSSHLKRVDTLNSASESFSDRLNKYIASHMDIRSVLQEAIVQANQYQSNNQFANPAMQSTRLPLGLFLPQGMSNHSFNAISSSPRSDRIVNGGRASAHSRSASGTAPQGSSRSLGRPTTGRGERRTSLPDQSCAPEKSSSASTLHPPSALPRHAATLNSIHQYRDDPSLSEKHHSPYPSSVEAGRRKNKSSRMTSTKYPPGQNALSNIAPLTTQLPMETQQLLDGSQGLYPNPFGNRYVPNISMTPVGFLDYSLHGQRCDSSESRFHYYDPSNFAHGLDQTLSLNAWKPVPDKYSRFSDPSSAVNAPATFGTDFESDISQGLGSLRDSDLGFDFGHADFGNGAEDDSNGGTSTPEVQGELVWNAEDLTDFNS